VPAELTMLPRFDDLACVLESNPSAEDRIILEVSTEDAELPIGVDRTCVLEPYPTVEDGITSELPNDDTELPRIDV
jgi:hypothetical protein